jgi:hypothetical protein
MHERPWAEQGPFLDFAGDWDPSLAFVMGGGVLVNLVLFRLALRRGAPLLAPSFGARRLRRAPHTLPQIVVHLGRKSAPSRLTG